MDRRKLKLWGGIGAGLFVLAGIGWLVNPEVPEQPKSDFTVAAPTPKATPSKAAEPTLAAKPSPKVEEAAVTISGEALAAKVEAAWLTEMGVEKPRELLKVLPDSLAGYVTKFEAVASDTVEITVQVPSSDASKDELKRLATSVLSTAGFTIEELDRVEVVTSDRLARGVENRRNVPLLNM